MRALLSFFFGLGVFAVSAQTTALPTPPQGLKYKLNYNIEETTFHLVAEGTPIGTLSPLDLDKMRPYTIQKQVERRITDYNHHATTVTILNPEEAYAEFPHHIGRIEINQAGKQIFGTNGALYRDMPADSAYQAEYNAMRNFLSSGSPGIMYEFPSMPDAGTIQMIEGLGGAATILPNNTWQVTMGTTQTLFEPNSSRITSTLYEGEVVKETRIQKFVFTAQGIYAPLEDLTKKPVVRPSGACMQDVVRKRYTNYTLAVSADQRNDFNIGSTTKKATYLWPNPVSDKLHLSLGSSVREGSTLQVFDLVGKLVFSKAVVQPGTEIEIPLSGWGDGLYFIRLETQAGVQTLKFVKKAE